MPLQEIQVLELPKEDVDRTKGMSLDIGGSAIKVIYSLSSSKDDKTSKVRLVSFPIDEIKEALKFIKENATITGKGPDGKPQIITTGIGCNKFAKEIKESLNTDQDNVIEQDCDVKAFLYLCKHLPKQEVVHDIPAKAHEEGKADVTPLLNALNWASNEGITQMTLHKDIKTADPKPLVPSSKPYSEDEDIFPCLIASLGSVFDFMKVQADGSFEVLDASYRGGKTFLGLGQMVTGAKSFTELIELATNGHSFRVDTYTGESVSEDEGDWYSQASANWLIHRFGQIVGKDKEDFKKEDLARSLLNMIMADVVQTSHLVAMSAGIKHVYFSGSFITNELVRHTIARAFSKRNIQNATLRGQGHDLDVQFLRAGSHLSATGAFLSEIVTLKSSKK